MQDFFRQHWLALVLLSLLSLIFISAGFWLWQHVERVTEEKEVGYQGVARYDPLLAAQRLLQRMSMTVTTIHHPPHVKQQLKEDDVLVLVHSYQPLSETKSQQLLDWVAQGGHVIMVSNTLLNQEDAEEDPILQALEVQQMSLELEDKEILQAPPIHALLASHPQPFVVNFQPDYVLQAQESDPANPHLLHLKWGKGHFTLLTDVWFLHNARIDAHDHAAFFWALLNLQQRPQHVWLSYPLSKGAADKDSIRRKSTQAGDCEDCSDDQQFEEGMPSLWTLLWEQAWYLLVSLSVLLLFWLWSASRRFGGLLKPPSQQRRRLLEHIEASGEFLWHTGHTASLLRGVRQHLFKELQRRHPLWSTLPPQDLSQCLAEHCALSVDRVQCALYEQQISSAATLTDAVQCLNHIRRHL